MYGREKQHAEDCISWRPLGFVAVDRCVAIDYLSEEPIEKANLVVAGKVCSLTIV